MPHHPQNIFPDTMRRVLVAGAGGVTGTAFCKLLNQNNIEVLALDQRELKPDNSLVKPILWDENFMPAEVLQQVDALSLTPGVPLSGELFQLAKQKNVPLFTELEYAASFLTDEKCILISGTDGKSTTSAMVHHLLPGSWIGGNFGTPLSEYILRNKKHEHLVLELSSYQLELCRNLSASCSLLLNIAPDHLDRYHDFTEYANVKLSIQDHLGNDGLFITSQKVYQAHQPKHTTDKPTLLVDTDNLVVGKISIVNNQLQDNASTIVDLDKTSIQGKHNHSNLLFAMAAVAFLKPGVPASKTKELISSFKTLEHRYEKVGSDKQGNIYINDSKATTCQAAIQAVNSAPGKTIWLIGGNPKGEDYNLLKSAISSEVTAILFGPGAADLEAKLNFDCRYFKDLEEVIKFLVPMIKNGTISEHRILLSPAMASFDSYPNYLERGKHFKELIQSLLV